MRLFYTPGTGRPFRVAWLLAEAGVEYEAVEVGWDARDAPEHRARSPLGRVPAVQFDDGTILFDSTAILLQLADLLPDAGLIGPLGTPERGQAYQWSLTAMTEMEPTSIRWGLAKDESGREQYLRAAGVCAEALDGREFLVGERLGVADIVLAGVLLGAEHFGLFLDGPPRLVEYLGALRARPTFAVALQRTSSFYLVRGSATAP
jgi:glutathione S-transferase